MSIDRVNPLRADRLYSGMGYPGIQPVQPVTRYDQPNPPTMFGRDWTQPRSTEETGLSRDVFQRSVPIPAEPIYSQDLVRYATPSVVAVLQGGGFVDQWMNKLMSWAPREFIDQYAQAVGWANKTAGNAFTAVLPKGVQSAAHDLANSPSPRAVLNLGVNGQLLTLKDVNPNIQSFSEFKNAFRTAQSGNFSHFLEGTTMNPLKYSKQILKGSIRSVGEMFSTGKNLIGGSVTLLGIGLTVADVVHETVDTYRAAKALEDGSLGSKLKTLGSTAWTFVNKSAKSAAGWVAGSTGFALGMALVPIPGLNVVSGLLLGTFLSTCMGTALGKIFPTRGADVETMHKRQEVAEAYAHDLQAAQKAEGNFSPPNNPFQMV